MNIGEYLRVYPYQWWTSPRCDPSLPARKVRHPSTSLPMSLDGKTQLIGHTSALIDLLEIGPG